MAITRNEDERIAASRRLSVMFASFLTIALVLTLSGCFGLGPARPKHTTIVPVGTMTWYVPQSVVLQPAATATPAGTGGSEAQSWTVQGSGTWRGLRVDASARPTTGVTSAAALIEQLSATQQDLAAFHELESHTVNVAGAASADELSFSYAGGEGVWVACVEAGTGQGAVVQVITGNQRVDAQFIDNVVSSVKMSG